MISVDELEKQLNKAIKKNDEKLISEVFESIYFSYYKLIGYVVSKYVIDVGEVEDIVSDTFVSFYKAMFKNKIRNIKYYLVTIAKNLTVSYLKKKKRIDIVYDDDIVFNAQSTEETKFDGLVDDLKNSLGETETTIIILHSLYDYSFKDIALKIGIPVNTVKTKYYRSLDKIRGKNEKR